MGGRTRYHLLIWISFYEQLAWPPVLAVLAAGFGDPEALALAVSAYSLANLGGNLLFGVASDRVGRLRVAGAGLLAMAGTAMLHLATSTPGGLVGARFLHGLAAATVAPAALAGISAGVPGNRRGEAMARAGLLIAVASMMAPPLTGRIADRFGVSVAVGTLGVGLVLAGLFTLAGRRAEPAGPAATGGPPEGGQVGSDHLDPVLAAVAAAVAFALMFGQNVLFYALPLKGQALGFTAARNGALLSAFALGAAIAFMPPLSRTADRWGRSFPLLIGLGLAALGMLGLAAAGAAPALAVSLFLYGFGFGLTFPAVTALSADAAGVGRRGTAYGLATAAFSAGAIVGPLVTRALSGLLSPFAVSAAVAMGGLLVIALARRRMPRVTAGIGGKVPL